MSDQPWSCTVLAEIVEKTSIISLVNRFILRDRTSFLVNNIFVARKNLIVTDQTLILFVIYEHGPKRDPWSLTIKCAPLVSSDSSAFYVHVRTAQAVCCLNNVFPGGYVCINKTNFKL